MEAYQSKPRRKDTDGDHTYKPTKKELSKLRSSRKRKTSYSLSMKDINTICKLLVSQSYTQVEIAKMVGVSVSTVARIASGETHTDISCIYNVTEDRKKSIRTTTPTVYKICQLLQDTDYSQAKIARKVGVPHHVVNRIFLRKSYKDISKKFKWDENRVTRSF